MTGVDEAAGKDRLMTAAEVGELFRVDRKTVVRWANDGRIASISTPGGHRRFWRSQILGLLSGKPVDQ